MCIHFQFNLSLGRKGAGWVVCVAVWSTPRGRETRAGERKREVDMPHTVAQNADKVSGAECLPVWRWSSKHRNLCNVLPCHSMIQHIVAIRKCSMFNYMACALERQKLSKKNIERKNVIVVFLYVVDLHILLNCISTSNQQIVSVYIAEEVLRNCLLNWLACSSISISRQHHHRMALHKSASTLNFASVMNRVFRTCSVSGLTVDNACSPRRFLFAENGGVKRILPLT